MQGRKMFDTVIIIVLYGKEISASTTFASLMNSLKQKNFYKVVIWNNGPKKLKEIFENNRTLGISVDIYETPDNISLSEIYNTVILSYNSKKYLFLDDDSDLSSDYLDKVSLIKPDQIGVPLIVQDNITYGPFCNKEIITSKAEFQDKDNITAIMSGVVVGVNILEKIYHKRKFYFDNRFMLYGIDTSFFINFSKLNITKKAVVLPPIDHSLSRLLKHDDISSFRLKERAYSEGLLYRYYYEKGAMLKEIASNIKKIFKKRYKKNESQYEIHFLVALISGRHYRNSSKFKKQIIKEVMYEK